MKVYKRFVLSALVVLSSGLTAAAPRSLKQMKAIASDAIMTRLPSVRRAPSQGDLTVFKRQDAVAVIGYETGGYAIVSTDDLLPAVLGYSETKYNEQNENLRWWLSAQEEAGKARIASGTPARIISPAQAGFPSEVAPMVTTNWGQEAPYNNLCPPGINSGTGAWQGYGGTGRCVTGCVATAMAQVLNYKRIPVNMTGSRTLQVNQGTQYSPSYTSYTYVFSDPNNRIDWDNMLDNYLPGQYNEAQGRAVANLMLACGFASDMEYALDGSGTYTDSASNGMNRYFGIDCEYRFRANYSDGEWMNIVYNELSNDRPIMYGGVDPSPFTGGGHEFVFDGYNAQGQVHVNWGWDGSDNGYFDVATLSVNGLSFYYEQDMVISIDGISVEPIDTVVTMAKPGDIALISDSVASRIQSLTVKGGINTSDLKAIRRMGGREQDNKKLRGLLRTLDLSEASLVKGGDDAYLIDTMTNKRYAIDAETVIPERAFYGLGLRTLRLPAGLTDVRPGAFAMTSISELEGLPKQGASYVVIDSVMYSTDTTKVVAVLPIVSGSYRLPMGVTEVGDYAMSGTHVTDLILPSSVKSLGREALAEARLASIRSYNKTVPVAGIRCFSGVGKIQVYVPAGCLKSYKQAEGWKELIASDESNVKEFGTLLKARNASRFYGEENKRFGYQQQGDFVLGDPVLNCEATAKSPAGKYTIRIDYGTVDPEGVDLQDGYLVVKKAPLTVSLDADTVRIHQGDEIPEFNIIYDGFVLTDNADSIDIKAVATTEATADSAPGVYPIVISGADDDCYSFSYAVAYLVIEESTTNGISFLRTDDASKLDIYDLSGRRVAVSRLADLPKGLYIVNGKKIAVK